ncbi:MAG: elongation factor G [Lachnoclostridium sp.]|jgi:elongation factor G|nr:elongation factor G [Lachnoclostridium sp.]
MKQYEANKIFNVAFVGHASSGKTTLAEAMLHTAGASERLGKVAEGNTVMDFDPEEKRRVVSISTAVAAIEWNDNKINLLDAPGLFDFEIGVCEALRAADTAVIVLSGKSGISVGAEKGFKAASKRSMKKVFFVNKMDSENADYYKVVNGLTEKFGSGVCPVVIPYVVDHKVQCYVNLVTGKAWEYANGKAKEVPIPDMGGQYDEMHNMLCEAVAGVDEDLMERYFSGDPLTSEEILKGLSTGIAGGDITPVYCGSGLKVEGIDLLMNDMVQVLPSADKAPEEVAKDKNDNEKMLKINAADPVAAIVFKTIVDPFVGKLSYFKVITGKITHESQIVNTRTGEHERIGKLLFLRGGKQIETPYISAGDIGAVAKLGDVLTGDTLSDAGNPVMLTPIDFPKPTLSMSITPVKQGEEDKIAQGLGKLIEEDSSISFETNTETKQQILSGLGEQHLDIIVSKLKNKFSLDVELSIPRMAYRETIRKKVRVQGKHKKQSGGHGQYGDVWIEFEPCESDTLVFEEKIFGGAVPKGYFPAVEKGLLEASKKGVLAGYPVVGLKATLVDGSFHQVDSSEMAFKMAASVAYKAGMPDANPTILEPRGLLKAAIPEDNMGDIVGEVNKRRGRVLEMNPMEEHMQEIVADVPMGEMGDFSTSIRSVTQGRGNFSLTFDRYEEAPPMVIKKVIEEAKAEEAKK